MKSFLLSIITALLLVFNTVSAEEAESLALIDNLSEAFESASNIIKPSVVTISSIKKIKKVNRRHNNRRSPYGGGSPFDDFFGDDFFNKFFEFQVPEGRRQSPGVGSGIIVNQDGYILTNNHVVAGADEVEVTLHDDKKYDAEIVGTDPKSDLAVLKIKAKNLTAARLGDSDKLKVGKWVVAVGNPFNLEQTITAGIISAKGRSDMGIADYEDFIQTDAAINPGNSGGPLVNLRGEVVGINTAIVSRSGGYNGIGFAIPVNMAKSIMNSLIDDGEVVRGFLGVMIQGLSEDLAKSFGLDSTKGALISEVSEDSPAAKSGLKEDDIIVEFDGKEVEGPSQLRNAVGQTAPDKKVDAKVFRDGEYKTIKVKVGKLESKKEDKPSDPQIADDNLGVDVGELTEAYAAKLGLKDSSVGVVVKYIEPGSIAQYQGIRRGDVIISINGKKVDSAKTFKVLMKKANLKEGIRVKIQRKGGKFYLFVKE